MFIYDWRSGNVVAFWINYRYWNSWRANGQTSDDGLEIKFDIYHCEMEERKDKTTIVVASRVSTVAHLDKIIVLNDGHLEAFDTPKNLLKSSPTYQRMVKLQELQAEVEGGTK